jgi:hypothetical protein
MNKIDFEEYNLIKLPANRSEYFPPNRGFARVDYTDLEHFFGNAKKLSVKLIYHWLYQNKNYAFVDRNNVVHQTVMEGGWESPNEKIIAEKNGFTNVNEFRRAKDSGFTKKSEYEDFQTTGFSNKKEWKKMETLGFGDQNTFNQADKLGCKNNKQYEELQDSGFPNMELKKEARKIGAMNMECLILIKTIQKLPDGLPIPYDKISQKFDEIQEEMYSEINNVRYSLNEEIFSEKPIIKLGMYENELELFYKGVKSPKNNLVAINEDKVIVDGNNIARHPNISPSIANLIRMKEALEEKEVTIFISHAIKNRDDWDDKEKLLDMISKNEIKVVTADQNDDYWWISFAIKENALIITNDKMRDWRAKNPKIAKNINKRRVGFDIQGENVVLGPPLGEVNV